MRIAEIAPLYESVPPKLYGGTERVVSYLTEELVTAGHDVTLFASADSRTRARLLPMCARALRLDECREPLAHHVRMLDEVFRRVHEFDVLHFHTDFLHFPLARWAHAPRLTTLHGRLDLPDLQPLYRTFMDEPLVSISNDQRTPLSWAGWRGTVYHGLPPDLLPPHERPGSYLAFLGRISPEKRPDRAIEVARRAGIPLKIAAKVDDVDRDYYQQRIKPLMDPGFVEYVGEISEREKGDFLGNALGLLFLIDWPEPFGLVLIEAMACGTPVVACRRGSVPELVEPGRTGVLVDSCDDAVAAVEGLARFDRAGCRRRFEERFLASRMAADYLRLFERQLAGRRRTPRAGRRAQPRGRARERTRWPG